MSDDISSPEWRAFAEGLIRERRETPATKPASASFVDRMTSSAADPGSARREAGGGGDAGTAASLSPREEG